MHRVDLSLNNDALYDRLRRAVVRGWDEPEAGLDERIRAQLACLLLLPAKQHEELLLDGAAPAWVEQIAQQEAVGFPIVLRGGPQHSTLEEGRDTFQVPR